MDKPLLISLFCLALILRMGAAMGIHVWLSHNSREYLIAGDADGYWRLGHHLASGQPYEVYQPPRQVLRMPGYPLLIASSIRLFGDSRLGVRLIQAFLASFSVVIVALLAKEFFERRVAIISGVLLAISPAAVAFSTLLLSETLFAVMLLLNLWLAVRWLKSGTTKIDLWGALLTGISTALVVYVRPTWIPAFVVWGGLAVILKVDKTRWVEATIVLLTGLLALSPWAYRNHSLTGHWVLTTLWSGPSLYDGFNPDATGASEMSFFDREQVMAVGGMSEYDMNRHYQRRAVEFMKSEPSHALGLMFEHARRYWSLTPNADQFRTTWLMLPLAIWNGLFLVLGAYGAWSFRRNLLPVIIIVGPMIAFAIIHTFFVGSLRYRLPAEYPFSIAVGVGMHLLWEKYGHKKHLLSEKQGVTL